MQRRKPSRTSSSGQSGEELVKLRRLSSITSITSLGSPHNSFTAWNPFTKRRQTTDSLSGASDQAIPEDHDIKASGSEQTALKAKGRTPMSSISGNRKSGSSFSGQQSTRSLVPRSSTFSHLPISTGHRRKLSDHQLPQASVGDNPVSQSRIPTPTAAKRARSQTLCKVTPMTSKVSSYVRPPRNSNVQRSSTQPVLPTIQATPPSEEKAVKENANAVAGNRHHDALHRSAEAASGTFKIMSDDEMWKVIEEVPLAEESLQLTDYSKPRRLALNPTPRKASSLQQTNEYAGIFYTTPMPARMHRGKSQPVIGSTTTNVAPYRSSQTPHHANQHHFMQQLRPLTPPVPHTPLVTRRSRLRQLPVSSDTLRGVNTPGSSSDTLQRRASPNPPSIREVSTAQPRTYWAGRLLAISDRLQTEYTSNNLFNKEDSNTCNGLDNPLEIKIEEEADRARRALTILYACCTTHTAVTSLKDFQQAYAVSTRLPAIAAPIATVKIEEEACKLGMVEEEETGVTNSAGMSVGTAKERKGFWARQRAKDEERNDYANSGKKSRDGTPGSNGGSTRKISFVEKLMGKRRRNTSSEVK
ncbi:MAG: hypothetical protein M1820_005596 [Bogoriella megaspora]|nr:MAG: hypothetical protein M1820_005596 [Bogoriella megaspora]